VEESSHALKHFIFDKTGRIFVNVGSHSDDCLTRAPITKPCAAGDRDPSRACRRPSRSRPGQ
jgi:hypothetical protein